MHYFLKFIFGIKFYMFRTVPMICWQLASRIRTERPDPARKLSANLYDIYHCCVQWKTADDGHRSCPKHVEFYSKNKFDKIVHLVGFIIIIYHDARSPERLFITMHGHLNINLSRCTVTRTSIYHDARAPERQKPLVISLHTVYKKTRLIL